MRLAVFMTSLWIAVTMVGCGGSGGDSGSGPSPTPPVPTGGQLAVAITGLPASATAAVTVSGPQFSRNVASSATLAGLTAGTYVVAASNVVADGQLYAPQSTSQDVAVSTSGASSVSVGYTAVRLALAEIASGLSSPTFATAPADDARLFIVERPGRIRIVVNGSLRATPFLDIAPRVNTVGEGGLLSMAFDPNYATNGFFYVDFVDAGGNIVVERFSVSADPNVASTTPLRILTIAHPTNTNHYGGLVAFGLDRMLYIGTGDGGGAGDPPRNAQNPNVLLGKLLRIDVRNATTATPYAIPPDNPFVGQAGRRGEVWAVGLRNPWRYAFDPSASRLFIADVGQDRREEVDVVATSVAGANYGWNVVEGSLCYPADPCDRSGFVAPVLEYAHDGAGGCSITGGFVYRGAAVPALAGHYFYSDYCSGWLRSFTVVNGAAVERIDWNIANVGSILSFGRDAQGELHVLSQTGRVYRIVHG